MNVNRLGKRLFFVFGLLVFGALLLFEYVGKLVSEGAKTAQDNFAKVYGKTA